MDSWGMILTGYAIVFATMVVYGLVVVRRGRRLAEELGLGEVRDGGDVGADHEDPEWT